MDSRPTLQYAVSPIAVRRGWPRWVKWFVIVAALVTVAVAIWLFLVFRIVTNLNLPD